MEYFSELDWLIIFDSGEIYRVSSSCGRFPLRFVDSMAFSTHWDANQRVVRRKVTTVWFKCWSNPHIVGSCFQRTHDWLVVWLPFSIFPEILGMSSSQLTNSYFSEGWRKTTNQMRFLFMSVVEPVLTFLLIDPNLGWNVLVSSQHWCLAFLVQRFTVCRSIWTRLKRKWQWPRFTMRIYPMTDPYVWYINGNIYHQYTPVLLAYIPYMDPMGTVKIILGFKKTWNSKICGKPPAKKRATDFSQMFFSRFTVFFFRNQFSILKPESKQASQPASQQASKQAKEGKEREIVYLFFRFFFAFQPGLCGFCGFCGLGFCGVTILYLSIYLSICLSKISKLT